MNVLMLLKPKSEVSYLYDTYTMRQGLEKLYLSGYTAVPVISRDGTYIGTVTEGDFLWNIMGKTGQPLTMRECEKHGLSEIIRCDFNPAVDVNVSMDEIYLRLSNQNFVPVTDDRGNFIGIVTRRDFIAGMQEKAMAECDFKY